MSLSAAIYQALALDPEGSTRSLDDLETTIRHGEIIRQKPFLRRIYLDHYAFFRRQAALAVSGPWLEIGSGAGFLKEVMPETVTSDVLPVPGIDRVCSALELPVPDASLAAIFMLNVLHHLPDAERFFREVGRTLRPGGRLAMVEPANTVWSRIVYRHFHHEPFCPESREWKLSGGGPLSGANGALPWIIFCRDRRRFEAQHPDLRIERLEYCHPFRYLLSGGVSLRPLVPACAYPVVAGLERILGPANRFLSMFMRIVVVKG